MIYPVRAAANLQTKTAALLRRVGGCSTHAPGTRSASTRGRASRPPYVAVIAALVFATASAPSLAQQDTSPPPAAAQASPAPQAAQTSQATAAQPAPAPVRPTAPAGYQPPAAPGAISLLQTLFALCFVLALLAGLAWLLKRFNPRAAGGSATLRMVSALNLGGRERILVVEVGDQWIVVGAAPGRVNLLTTMPKQEGVVTPPGAAHGVPAGFADWLKQTLDKRNAK
jgi:flagellar protein FliO/FliZ